MVLNRQSPFELHNIQQYVFDNNPQFDGGPLRQKQMKRHNFNNITGLYAILLLLWVEFVTPICALVIVHNFGSM